MPCTDAVNWRIALMRASWVRQSKLSFQRDTRPRRYSRLVPVDPGSLLTRYPDVFAVGDVTSVSTAKAGVFAEGQARVVADQLAARIGGTPNPPGYDGTGSCYIEFGYQEVARVDVDFFSTPGRPSGTFTPPSPATADGNSRTPGSAHAGRHPGT